MNIIRSVKKIETKLDLKAGKFVWHHPFLGFLFIFIGMPVFILACVSVSTVVIAFPIAWLFGWL
ncbi:MAG: hypothetical protein Q4C91_06925 [Eubacteriales bacterium]|nr:hypothetical protein [Eubacteriales bacterium]